MSEARSFERSKELYERARRSLAGGVSSHFRLFSRPVPLFFTRGKGSRLWDADGNEFIDYTLGQGPLLFGHSPDFLLEAVRKAMEQGQIYAGQHELEIRVAERVQRLVPCAELVRFGLSGSEMVHAALRLARAYTGRSKFIKFEGHYHGWFDEVLFSVAPPLEMAGEEEGPKPVPWSQGQDLDLAAKVIVLPWNNREALRRTVERHADEIAAILTEPIMANTNCILPQEGYLEEMRQWCDRYGILLIFDEVITGFRVALGGAQEFLGVVPDLAVFGKAMAGGFPVSMLAGRREVMELLADGRVIHAGTLNSHVMGMAAAEACLEKLEGEAVHRHLFRLGQALMEGLRERARRHSQPLLVQGPGPMFWAGFGTGPVVDYRSHLRHTDAGKLAQFTDRLLERGLRPIPRGLWYLSAAHTEEDVETTLRAVDESLRSL